MDVTWTQAVAAWNEAHGVVCLHGGIPGGVPDAVMDAATSIERDALDGLLALPAPDRIAVGTKINALLDYQDGNEIDRQALRRIAADASQPGNGDYDQPLLDAFAARRQEFEATYDTEMTREDEDGYFARLEAYETVLHDTPAMTIEGVIAKLRIAFMHQNGSAWSDRAIMDPTHADFVAGLADSDMYTQMTWSAIEDLARIGNINLAEQGR